MDRKSIVISANPKSGARSGLDVAHALNAALNERGFACELYTNLDEMWSRVAELHEQSTLRTVVSAGGDGTAALIASRLPIGVPMTLMPIGSENLLAKYFGMSRNIDSIVSSIQTLKTVALDAFLMNGRISLLMGSVGFDAEVVREVHQNRRSHVTQWQYWRAIFKASLSYRWPLLQIELLDRNGDVTEAIEGSWLFAFNVPAYASRIRIVSEASIDDGMVEVCIFKRGGFWRGLQYFWHVRRGTHDRLADWVQHRVPGVRVKLADTHQQASISYQQDGDWGGELPLEILYSGQQIQLVMP